MKILILCAETKMVITDSYDSESGDSNAYFDYLGKFYNFHEESISRFWILLWRTCLTSPNSGFSLFF